MMGIGIQQHRHAGTQVGDLVLVAKRAKVFTSFKLEGMEY